MSLVVEKDSSLLNMQQQAMAVDSVNRELSESQSEEAERLGALESALAIQTERAESLESLITSLRVKEVGVLHALSALPPPLLPFSISPLSPLPDLINTTTSILHRH